MMARPDRQDPLLETHRAWPDADRTWCGRPIRYVSGEGGELSLRGPDEEPSCLGCHYYWWRLALIYG